MANRKALSGAAYADNGSLLGATFSLAPFVGASAFARIADIGERASQKALGRAYRDNMPWRGHLLDVRAVPSRGGASGVAYEVAVASLPRDLAAKLAAAAKPPALPFRPPSRPDWRLRLALSVIEAGPAGSDARAVQLRAVAKLATYPTGERAGQVVAERTLRAWIATYEARGMLPLATRTRRADRGAARVIAWREWDRAMAAAGVPDAKQRGMAAQMDATVRGCWAAGEASAANIALLMGPECRKLAEAAGVNLPEADMARLCRMPLHFAARKDRRRARMAHIKRTDAARWHANHVPRVRRHRDGMRPMDLVAADVRHSDILYRRPDGSLATAKMVCFLDLATNRIFARPFLLPAGEMIRREHVLLTMRDMAEDPAWGLWRGLYMDNGGEFKLGLSADDLPRLVDLVRHIHGEADAEGCGNITSKPHNPQSKVIEGIFSAFTRSIEAPETGFIGGNRMAKKTQNQGRAPVPMPGDETTILARYAKMMALYNAKPQQRGHIKGRSPNDAFRAFVDDEAKPWRAIVLPAGEFSLAFGKDAWKSVRIGGELHIGGRVLTHPDLAAMVGEKVRVRVPILAPDRAVVLTDKDEPLLVAAEAATFGFRDRDGAKAHGRGQRDAGAAAKKAATGAAKVNIPAMRDAYIASVPPPVPLPPAATATLHPVLCEAAEAHPVLPLPSRREVQRRRDADAQETALRIAAEAFRRAG